MNWRKIVYSAFCVGMVFSVFGDNLKAKKKKKVRPPKPHVLLITASGLGFSDLGCYGGEIPTPNIDLLSKTGLRFRNFYHNGERVVSRAALFTGLYPPQVGLGKDLALAPGRPIGAYQGYLSRTCGTAPEIMRMQGYSAALFGTWHLGLFPPHRPVHWGWQKFVGGISSEIGYFRLDQSAVLGVKPDLLSGEEPWQPFLQDFYLPRAITDEAVAWIQNHKADQSMFVQVNFQLPGPPLQAKEEAIEPWLKPYSYGWNRLWRPRYNRVLMAKALSPGHSNLPDWPKGVFKSWHRFSPEERADLARRRAVFAAQLTALDQAVGRLIAAIDAKEMRQETAILFIGADSGFSETSIEGSDLRADLTGAVGGVDSFGTQGAQWAAYGAIPYQRLPGALLEGNLRGPLIFSWGDQMPAGAWSDDPVHILDVVPTLCEIAQTKYPSHVYDTPLPRPPGISLMDIMRDRPERLWFWQQGNFRAVRSGDWKLIFEEGGEVALFNLANDPVEKQNLATLLPDKVDVLKSQFTKYEAHCGLGDKLGKSEMTD